MYRTGILIILLLALSAGCWAEDTGTKGISRVDGLMLTAEGQTSFSDGRTPLWLNANKYGVSSLEGSNGYLRVRAERDLHVDDSLKWGMGYGADFYAGYNHSAAVNVQQLYFKLRYKLGSITFGQKEEPAEMWSQELSSGGQTLGINARPVPGVRLALDDYWDIPGLRKFLGFKGHIYYGVCTDGNYQEGFTGGCSQYVKNTLLHTKAGYLRFGKTKHPFTVEAGLQWVTQFGGTVYYADGTVSEQDKGFGAFIKALYGGRSAAESGYYTSSNGNVFGSWVLRLNYEKPSYGVHVYMDKYFDDDSQMFGVDYDGYQTGEKWLDRDKSSYIVYKFKDMMLGLDVELKKFRAVNHFVMEYLYTKYQSGPIYHDHTQKIADHLGGRDDYYNHMTYDSWSHWGQVMGNPLYQSPQYNADGSMRVADNRFWAWHFGFSGDPVKHLHYRVLATWQKGWGTYDTPYSEAQTNFSFLAEAGYDFSALVRGLFVKGGVGVDHGGILGDNVGGQVTVRWTYGIRRKGN